MSTMPYPADAIGMGSVYTRTVRRHGKAPPALPHLPY